MRFYLSEMLIGSEAFRNLMPAHNCKADAVGEAVFLILMFCKQLPGSAFIPLRHPYSLDLRRVEKDISNLDSRLTPETRGNKCNNFIEYVVGNDKFSFERGKSVFYSFVVRVLAVDIRIYGAGVEENLFFHFFR